MPTPFGEINTEITYQFSGDQEIPDGEPMNSALETHQEIRYRAIPLGFEYNIIRFSKIPGLPKEDFGLTGPLKTPLNFTPGLFMKVMKWILWVKS